MGDPKEKTLALFYCQSTPGSTEADRQELYAQYGDSIRLFPLPCSGRMEPLHLLRALEEFADGAYLIACPEGACRYFEGNLRAKKRLGLVQKALEEIGLEASRVGVITADEKREMSLAQLVAGALDDAGSLPPSPVHKRA